MADVKIELNSDGIQELLKSQFVTDELKRYADGAASRLGDGYEVTTYIGTTRANASIAAVSSSAIKDNFENNTILKAVSG